MARSRSITYVLLSIISLCSIYWLLRTDRAFGTLGADNKKFGQQPPERSRVSPIGDDTAGARSGKFGDSQLQEQQGISSEELYVGPASGSNNGRAGFPRKIWQTSSKAGRDQYAAHVETWKKLEGFEHHWLSDKDADDFVHETFSTIRPSLTAFWDDLSTDPLGRAVASVGSPSNSSDTLVDSTASSAIVLRADLLRYMLMLVKGGVYADIDTSVLLHVDQWIPEHLKSQAINAVIGIEYDDTTYKMFVRPVSFCQWTLMAKPNHPIFARAINRVVSNLEFLARHQRVQSLSELQLDKLDVLEATGPGMISDVVLEVIRDQSPGQEISWSTFHDQREAKLYGDVLILPINGFAGGQKHSHSGHPDYGQRFVKHHFGRSWYRPHKAQPLNTRLEVA